MIIKTYHENHYSFPEQVASWRRLWVVRVNCFPHLLHGYGLSPVCVFKCVFKLLVWANSFPQTSHSNGRSPVWTLLWLVRWDDNVNFLPQTSHSKGLTPLWTFRCSSKLYFSLKAMGQTSQKCFLSGWSSRMCCLKSFSDDFHTEQSLILHWNSLFRLIHRIILEGLSPELTVGLVSKNWHQNLNFIQFHVTGYQPIKYQYFLVRSVNPC